MIDRIKLCAGVLLSCATVLGATGGCVGRPGASGEGSTGGDSGGGGSSDTGSSDTGSSGTGSSGTGSSGTGSSGTGGGSQSVCDVAGTIHAGRAPIRRLTRFEFNNTVRDLLGDTTFPGDAFPSEESGNGFGNDADAQPVASLLAEQYNTVAEAIANRIVTTPALYARFAPCAAKATTEATEEACVRSIAERFAASAYRRPLEAGEADGLVALEKLIRTKSDFKTSLSALIEAVLQSPDFLYRVEWGKRDADGHLRPSGYEMATRLSYFLWGTQPDQTLLAAAVSGELETKTGVLTQATRLLADPQARSVVSFFFNNLLPISGLSQLERDAKRYPKFSSQVGALMRKETETFLDNEIFAGSGTWVGALTAPYTFVNGPLATFYGIPGVAGDAFKKVDLDTTQRLGLLTQAGIVAGTVHSNETNPVVRGSFIVQKLMCRTIPFPTGDIAAKVIVPAADSGKTGRQRFSAHSTDPVCASCHRMMDPIGLAFENYDPVGLWRDTENGEKIDASGSLPGTEGVTQGPTELVRKIAASPDTHNCFASNWLNYAYGRTLGEEDACTESSVQAAFEASGTDVQALLLSLTQTDAFLYLPEKKD